MVARALEVDLCEFWASQGYRKTPCLENKQKVTRIQMVKHDVFPRLRQEDPKFKVSLSYIVW